MRMSKVWGRRALTWPVLVALAVAAMGTLYLTFATTPLDLAVYRQGGTNLLHDPGLLYESTVRGYPFTYPPFAAVLFTLVAITPERLATFAVTSLSMLALARSLQLVARRSPWTIWRTAWALPLAIAAAGALEPVYETLHFGQVNLLIMWAVIEDLLAPATRRWRGALLGVVAGVKLTPLVFLLLPLLQRHWRTLVVAVGAFAAGVGVGFAVVPSASVEFWTSAILDPGRTGDVGFAGNQSLNGLVARATQPGGNLVLWLAGEAVVLAGTVAVAHLLVRRGETLQALLATAMGGLLLSPVSWVHHFVWEAPLLMLLAESLASAARRTRAAVATATLIGAWLVATLARTPYWFPFGDGREYHQPWPEQLATDSLTLITAATLVWFATVGSRQHLDAPPVPSGD